MNEPSLPKTLTRPTCKVTSVMKIAIWEMPFGLAHIHVDVHYLQCHYAWGKVGGEEFQFDFCKRIGQSEKIITNQSYADH